MTADTSPNDRMNAILAGLLNSERDITVSVEATRLVGRLREEDPELLRDWLWHNAAPLLATVLSARNRSRRMYVRRTSEAVAFGTAVASGDPAELAPFRVRHVVDTNRTQREVGRMTGDDHLFVAQSYDFDAQTSQMLAAFHRAVARRVGDRMTREVMDEATYLKLYGSIVGGGSS